MKYDYSPYIGIPYLKGGRDIGEALDCWGFVVLIYKELYSVTLPIYQQITPNNAIDKTSGELVETELYKICSVHDVAKEGDILIFSVGGRPLHIGIALDNHTMIHCDRNVGSVVENFRIRKWQMRLHKICRHPSLSF